MVFVFANVKKHRLKNKQPTPAHYALSPGQFAALADEAWSELTSLNDDKRRKHMHYVHVRTNNPDHRQPSSFTREEFWRHMERVYKDASC